MILYTLILTITTTEGVAVTSVPGFQSAEAGMAAGKHWAQAAVLADCSSNTSYICVPLK